MPFSPTNDPLSARSLIGLEQLDRVDVEHVLGRAERPERLVRAAGAQQVADAQGLGPQGIGDQGDAVAVAGDHVQDRLDALGGHQRGGGQGRHRHPVAIVADAQGVDLAGQAAGQLPHRARVGPLRRRDFRQQERFAR